MLSSTGERSLESASVGAAHPGDALAALPVSHYASEMGEMAYRSSAAPDRSAPTIVFLHGWPFNAFSYRKLFPFFADRAHCVFADWPGMGESGFDPARSRGMDFTTLAEALSGFLRHLGAGSVAIVAHDTGATIARLAMVAAVDGVPVARLACLSTELPGHRPAFIPLFQKLFAAPLSKLAFSRLLRSRAFLRSPLGFGDCFVDRNNIDDEFVAAFVSPLIEDRERLDGLIAYLRGIDWRVVDRLDAIHAAIEQPTAMIWGERDAIFPIKRARASADALRDGRFIEIPDAGFLALEERPKAVADALSTFIFDSEKREGHV